MFDFLESGADRDSCEYALVFLHGFGANARDVCSIASVLNGFGDFSGVRFLFPEAPVRKFDLYEPVEYCQSWYDYKGWFPTVKIEQSVDEAVDALLQLVRDAAAAGRLPFDRIFLGGFSQGGAVAVEALCRSQLPFAGVIALSADYPLSAACSRPAARPTPIFLGHGLMDPMVPIQWKEGPVADLKAAGYAVEEGIYEGLAHGIGRAELADVARFMAAHMKSAAA